MFTVCCVRGRMGKHRINTEFYIPAELQLKMFMTTLRGHWWSMSVQSLQPLYFKGRIIGPHKAQVAPDFSQRKVLVKEPWTFVSLWLRRQNKPRAGYFWDQAWEFYKASLNLTNASRPLLLYYAYMNAAKALLESKGQQFREYHGVVSSTDNSRKKISLSNETVRIKNGGVLPGLSAYYSEADNGRDYTLKEILFNLPFVHRTYCLTYRSQTDMFVPLHDCRFVFDSRAKSAFFQARVSRDFANRHVMSRLPSSFVAKPDVGSDVIQSSSGAAFSRAKRPTAADLSNLIAFHRDLRADLFYIRGTQTLWYLKSDVKGPAKIPRQTPTLVLAAMHRLSELCRYRPLEWSSFQSGQQNWLISEFIGASADQYIDEIASEITGFQFLEPNVRPAS